jgi:hypothetical protein
MGAGVKVIRKFNRGRICYDSIPEISQMNLEEYRKPPSESWMITVDQKT